MRQNRFQVSIEVILLLNYSEKYLKKLANLKIITGPVNLDPPRNLKAHLYVSLNITHLLSRKHKQLTI